MANEANEETFRKLCNHEEKDRRNMKKPPVKKHARREGKKFPAPCLALRRRRVCPRRLAGGDCKVRARVRHAVARQTSSREASPAACAHPGFGGCGCSRARAPPAHAAACTPPSGGLRWPSGSAGVGCASRLARLRPRPRPPRRVCRLELAARSAASARPASTAIMGRVTVSWDGRGVHRLPGRRRRRRGQGGGPHQSLPHSWEGQRQCHLRPVGNRCSQGNGSQLISKIRHAMVENGTTMMNIRKIIDK